MGAERAIRAIERRARSDRAGARARWAAATGIEAADRWAAGLAGAGRLTVNFHPDRIGRDGRSVAAGLLDAGAYHSQWLSGLSAGSRSAVPGGDRQRFERDHFDGAYEAVDASSGEHAVYGALDLTVDDHGGSPRFGSSFLVLGPHVRRRTTLCVGDSHATPRDVGTFEEPWSILAGLAEQAAQGDLLGRGLGPDALFALVDGDPGPGSASRVLDGYVEAQVHGGVALADDVQAIVLDPSFRGTEIEGALAAAAERYGFDLAWHQGSELDVGDVPADFRGPTMPALADRVARPGHVVHARAIGVAAARLPFVEPARSGDPPRSPEQQLKYLWHTVLAFGRAARDG